MSDRYTLYGAELSLYSGKARAYLRKKGLPFKEVAASIKVYKSTIVPNTGVRYLPVLETPAGKFLQDTSIIIQALEKAHPEHPVLPETPKQRFVADLLELYADEWLLIPAMHYRWNFPEKNQPFIYQEFGRVVLPWAPRWLRGMVGKKAGARFKGAVENLGITPKSIPAIETSYKAFLADLDRHLQDYPFVLGTKPSLADFGLIGPLYAHLYRDPYPGQLMRLIAPNVVDWVERMMSSSPAAQTGDFIANDEIPASLEPILRRFASEQWPVLKDSVKKLAEWREKNTDLSVPRFIGHHSFKLAGVEAKRMVLPYSVWMLQRVLESNQALELQHDKAFVEWLENMGLGGILDLKIATPMQRINNRLYFKNE